MTDRTKSQAGFTLLEVLVALAILSVALGALIPVFADMTRGRATLTAEETAVAVARAKLEALGSEIPLVDGVFEGAEGEVAWRVEIAPYAPPTRGALLAAKQATVTVRWPGRSTPKTFSVSTVRVVANASP